MFCRREVCHWWLWRLSRWVIIVTSIVALNNSFSYLTLIYFLEPARPLHRRTRSIHPPRSAIWRSSRTTEETDRRESSESGNRSKHEEGRLGTRKRENYGVDRAWPGEHRRSIESESVCTVLVRYSMCSRSYFLLTLHDNAFSMWYELRVVLHNRENTLLTQAVRDLVREEVTYAETSVSQWSTLSEALESMPFE